MTAADKALARERFSRAGKDGLKSARAVSREIGCKE
jgi:hypothetical protein